MRVSHRYVEGFKQALGDGSILMLVALAMILVAVS